MNALRTTAIAAALVAGSTVGASAVPIYATGATIVVDGPRGTANDRGNIANALGESLGDFFELGIGAVVDFTFGKPFVAPGNIVEVTFGSLTRFPESVQVQGGSGGVFTDLATLSNVGAQAPEGASFSFAGVYDTLRLIDTTTQRGSRPGGFDVDRISVSAIPLPATGAALLGGLGALLLLRRRLA